MAPERRTVLYSGTVQGVGFRWTTMRALQDLTLTGYVRNLLDGRVELLLEGETADLDRALARIRDALGAHIHEEAQTVTAATGEFAGFGVQR